MPSEKCPVKENLDVCRWRLPARRARPELSAEAHRGAGAAALGGAALEARLEDALEDVLDLLLELEARLLGDPLAGGEALRLPVAPEVDEHPAAPAVGCQRIQLELLAAQVAERRRLGRGAL